MENSFQLLSSMSPKIKGRQKIVKRAVTVLATKKHFRRSSIYENILPTIKNENLKVAAESSGTTSVITLSSDDEVSKENVFITQEKQSSINSPDKTSRIQQWLENVEPAFQKDNLTMFSQVSTIFGEASGNLKISSEGVAAHSTFCDDATKRFDECFKKVADLYEGDKNLQDILEISATNSDDSFVINKSLTSRIRNSKEGAKSKLLEVSGTPESSNLNLVSKKFEKALDGSQKSQINSVDSAKNSVASSKGAQNISSHKHKNSSVTPKRPSKMKTDDNLGVSVEDMDSIMSTLYGQEWNSKKDILLPKSAPQNRKKLQNKQVDLPTTADRKNMPPIKGNLMDNKVNFNKLRQPLNSPWMERFKNICDSDSSSDRSTSDKLKCKARLDFSDSESKSNSRKNSDKENSNWGESLEERIRKKMNNIKVPPEKHLTKSRGKTEQKLGSVKKGKSGINFEQNFVDLTKKPTSKVVKKRANSLSSSESNDVNESDVSSDEEFDMEITRIVESKRKSNKNRTEGYTFLESLSKNIPLSQIEISAKLYRTNYVQHRDNLARKLFDLYNKKVFDSAIPTDSELCWNDRLRGTAGMCHCKKITHRSGKIERKIKISLSTKVLDSPDRLRDTLIHEMCHAATWIVNQVSNGHGSYWKSWAIKAMKTFPELPPIQRFHSYAINTKYTYKCTQCGYSFGRHTKSVDVNKKCCGICHGKFEVLINKTTKKGETKSIPATPKKQPTGFALFVKENYAAYKEPAKKHGDVMRILGQKFAEMKVKK